MFCLLKKKIVFSLVIFHTLLNTGMASAMDEAKIQPNSGKFPSKFAIPQQQGSTCFYIPFVNLKIIRENRQNNHGNINLGDFTYRTKIDSYSWFLPQIRTLDHAYDHLRRGDGDYATYERTLRFEGIKSSHRYSEDGKPIEGFDLWPTDTARRLNYTPYNIKVEESPYNGMRWVPILHNKDDGQLYFYDYTSKSAVQLEMIPLDGSGKYNSQTDYFLTKYVNHESAFCYEFFTSIGVSKDKMPESLIEKIADTPQCYRFNDKILSKMGVTRHEISNHRLIPLSKPFLGSETAFYIQKSPEALYNTEDFYEVGAYQHILFACGVDQNNDPIAPESFEWHAYQDFKTVMDEDLFNPWANIDKNDLFEYHLTNIFKNNSKLKHMAMESVDFYNNPWKFYQESFNFYDNPMSPKIKFSYKQKFLPGEDQMLAYFFSSQLRSIWAASIGIDALCEIWELNEELGESAVTALRLFSFLPGVPSVSEIVQEASAQKYSDDQGKYSFLDVWDNIRDCFLKTVSSPLGKIDFVTFSGHGCVISFDPDLVKIQFHEDRTVAKRLGFEMWETLYEKGLKPFYQKPGTQEDLVKFS